MRKLSSMHSAVAAAPTPLTHDSPVAAFKHRQHRSTQCGMCLKVCIVASPGIEPIVLTLVGIRN